MNAKELITKDLSHVDVPRIKEYVANKVDTDNSSAVDKAVEEFLDNFNQWKDIVGFNIGLGEDSEVELTLSIGSSCLSKKKSKKPHQLDLSASFKTDQRSGGDCSDPTTPMSSSSATFDHERKQPHWLFHGLKLK